MSAPVKGLSYLVEVTPTISTSAYAANDQVGGIMTISTGAIAGSIADGYILQSMTIIDKGKQSAEIVVFFFDELPTVASSDNAALDISDAEMADKCLGTEITTTYRTVSGSSTSTTKNSGLGLKVKTGAGSGKIYAVAKTNGTPTYASTSDLVFKFHLLADI